MTPNARFGQEWLLLIPDSARNEPFLAESGIRWSRVTPVDLVSSTIHVTAVTFAQKIQEKSGGFTCNVQAAAE